MSGAGAKINWSPQCAIIVSPIRAVYIFPGIILQTPLNGKGGQRRRRARSERREKSRDMAGDKGI
jgi:hypothetical protein